MNTRSTHEFFLSRLTGTVAALLIAVQLFFIIKDASWTLLRDDYEFLTHFVSGKPFLPSDNFFEGRFTPLAFIEYNFFIPLGDCPYAYYGWVCVKYLISLLFFFLIQRAVFDLTGLKRLSRDYKLLVFSTCTIVFFLLPGFFTVFMDVIYYENTSIPISLILIYTLVSVFKRPSVLKMFVALVLFNALIYLKETYVIFFVPFLLMALFVARYERQSAAFRLVVAGLISVVIFLVAYVLLSGSQTDVFYYEKYDDSLLYGLLWMTLLNPTLFTVLIYLSFLVALGKSSFAGTRFVTISVLTLCAFFLVTGVTPMGYQVSIVYPFLFFTTQIELSSLIERNPKALKVLLPLLIVLTICSGIILTGISGLHIIGRGHHFAVLEFIEEWSQEKNAQTYIYKGKHYGFRKTQLGVALHFITNGNASMESAEYIIEIESISEVVGNENSVLFFPSAGLFSPNSEKIGLLDQVSHQIDTVIGIDGFEYNAVLLNKN